MNRWTGADPAQLIDGPNVYAYVRGNPIISWDPVGLSQLPMPPDLYNGVPWDQTPPPRCCCEKHKMWEVLGYESGWDCAKSLVNEAMDPYVPANWICTAIGCYRVTTPIGGALLAGEIIQHIIAHAFCTSEICFRQCN